MRTALAILVSSAVFAAFACNAILANDPGVLGIADEADAEPAPEPAPEPDAEAPTPVTKEDGAVLTSPPLVPPDAGNPCPPGQRQCGSVCVAQTDPRYGCGGPACAPCAVAHGTAACQGGACVVAACSKGYANCNINPADGCETELTEDPANCGACGRVCPKGTTCKNNGCRPGHDLQLAPPPL